jgi:hypothetical protein
MCFYITFQTHYIELYCEMKVRSEERTFAKKFCKKVLGHHRRTIKSLPRVREDALCNKHLFSSSTLSVTTNTIRAAWDMCSYYHFHIYIPAHAGSSLADFSTLKMEAIRSHETSVQSTTSTRRHTSEDGILHSNIIVCVTVFGCHFCDKRIRFSQKQLI